MGFVKLDNPAPPDWAGGEQPLMDYGEVVDTADEAQMSVFDDVRARYENMDLVSQALALDHKLFVTPALAQDPDKYLLKIFPDGSKSTTVGVEEPAAKRQALTSIKTGMPAAGGSRSASARHANLTFRQEVAAKPVPDALAQVPSVIYGARNNLDTVAFSLAPDDLKARFPDSPKSVVDTYLQETLDKVLDESLHCANWVRPSARARAHAAALRLL